MYTLGFFVSFGVFRSGEYDATVKKVGRSIFFDVNPICQPVTGWARSRNKHFFISWLEIDINWLVSTLPTTLPYPTTIRTRARGTDFVRLRPVSARFLRLFACPPSVSVRFGEIFSVRRPNPFGRRTEGERPPSFSVRLGNFFSVRFRLGKIFGVRRPNPFFRNCSRRARFLFRPLSYIFQVIFPS